MKTPVMALVLAAVATATSAATQVEFEVWRTTDPALASESPRVVATGPNVDFHQAASVRERLGGVQVERVHAAVTWLPALRAWPIEFPATDSVFTLTLTPGAVASLDVQLRVNGADVGGGVVQVGSTGGEAFLLVTQPGGDHVTHVVHLRVGAVEE